MQVLLNVQGREGGKPVLAPAFLIGLVAAPTEADAETAFLKFGRSGAGKMPAGPYYAFLTSGNRALKAALVHVVGVLDGEDLKHSNLGVVEVDVLFSTCVFRCLSTEPGVVRLVSLLHD